MFLLCVCRPAQVMEPRSQLGERSDPEPAVSASLPLEINRRGRLGLVAFSMCAFCPDDCIITSVSARYFSFCFRLLFSLKR